MKILFLTDSLSLPRNTKTDKVSFENTYPFLLKNHFQKIEFIFLGIGGATITDIYNQSSYYTGINADLIFIQCGIVDCAPRPLSKLETKIINKLSLRFLFKPFIKLLTKYRSHKYTSVYKFENTLKLIKNSIFKNTKVIAIEILPASKGYENKLQGITSSIKTYNEVLKKHLETINNDEFPKNGILSDFHHLTEIGHEIIFKKLKAKIEQAL